MKKIPEIFTFGTLAPIFVIVAHANVMSIPYFTDDFYLVTYLVFRLLSFVVPAFIFASGLKLSRKYADDSIKLNYFQFLGSRLLKIYLPYVFWVAAYYFYFINRGLLAFNWQELLIYIGNGQLVDHLYFVVAIMQLYLLFPLILRFCKKTTPIIGILLTLPLTIAGRIMLDSSAWFLSHIIFFVLGCYAGAFYDEFLNWLKRLRFLLYPSYIVVAGAHLFMSFQHSIGNFNYEHRHTMTVVFCALSILVFYHICVILNNSAKKREHGGLLARNLSSASYYVYLSHILVLLEVQRRLAYFGAFDSLHRYLIMLAIGIIVPFAVFVPYVKLKQMLFKKK